MLVFTGLCVVLVAVPADAMHGGWYRKPRDEPEHPVHNLFRRQTDYPKVGSAEWAVKYPAGALQTADVPKTWQDALNIAIADGRIPANVPVASSDGRYILANGAILNPANEPVCSSAVGCRGNDQVYDVPDGVVALSFDDGPLPASRELYKFLKMQNQTVTHFFIGSNILQNPEIFLEAFSGIKSDIAVQTWSHPHMPQLSNELVLAELGWTMQIIHDSTGGRLPRYWRPPYGESDNRVRAIAREVFGLTAVIWNQDTDDWDIGRGQTVAGATRILTQAYSGPKSPGLNIRQHELSKECVDVFMQTYPLIKQNGWEPKSVPDALGQSWYLNAADDNSPVTERSVSGGPDGSTQVDSGSSAGGWGDYRSKGVGTSSARPFSSSVLSLVGATHMVAAYALI